MPFTIITQQKTTSLCSAVFFLSSQHLVKCELMGIDVVEASILKFDCLLQIINSVIVAESNWEGTADRVNDTEQHKQDMFFTILALPLWRFGYTRSLKTMCRLLVEIVVVVIWVQMWLNQHIWPQCTRVCHNWPYLDISHCCEDPCFQLQHNS